MVSRSLFAVIFVLVMAAIVLAQQPGERPTLVINRAEQTARLVDEFGLRTSEERSARFDSFFQEISQSPYSMGYVLLYCGMKCRYGEIEAHIRGIELKIALRKLDRSKLFVVHGGYRDAFYTELWMIPKGAAAPTPRGTVNIRHVVFVERGKYFIAPYDCCDDFSDVWNSIKP